eukprot:6045618-Alexandrium_andersonii.AAC.1
MAWQTFATMSRKAAKGAKDISTRMRHRAQWRTSSYVWKSGPSAMPLVVSGVDALSANTLMPARVASSLTSLREAR